MTIVSPCAYESGSTCVLCWWPDPPSVYGSSLIGVGITLPAEMVEARSSAKTTTANAVHRDLERDDAKPFPGKVLASDC